MTLTLPAAQVRPGDVVVRSDLGGQRVKNGRDAKLSPRRIQFATTLPVDTVGVSDGAVVTIRCGDGLLMALADHMVTVLRETQT